MSTTIDQAFITSFEDDVKLAYQQGGSKARGTVRLATNVVGSTKRFFVLGKGSANRKTRHGKVVPMNAVHSYKDATLEDWYGGDWVDKLDEAKISFDEKMALARTGAYALGRKVDSLIYTAAAAAALNTVAGGTNIASADITNAIEYLNGYDVPDDGERYCAVSPKSWTDLLWIPEFTSADYVGPENRPWLTGTQAKRWLNTIFYMSTQLPLAATTRTNLLYHRSAVGWAEGGSIAVDITWHGDYAAHFINSAISGGAVGIDGEGIVKITRTE